MSTTSKELIHQPFKALAQGEQGDYSIPVIPVRLVSKDNPVQVEPIMSICSQQGPIYISKEQAMTFFGLVEPS